MIRLLMVPTCAATFLLSLVIALSVLPAIGWAQIYKYQDATGKWQFTDKPPQAGQEVKIYSEKSNKKRLEKNIKKTLERKFKPLSAIEKATTAVVKVQTTLGSGSGFFVSQDGFLVTNRHVIRPAKLATADIEKTFFQAEGNLIKSRKLLATKRAQLAKNQRRLTDYVRYFEGLSDSEQAQERRAYNKKIKSHASNRQAIERFSARLKSEASELGAARSRYNLRHSNTMLAQQFTIILKDDTPLNARLVALSDRYDLALLKVDGHTTPFIPIAKNNIYRQGHEVFAIGSPLGNTDYMTSGIITSLKRDQIVIDAQILPGNSGGPLINSQGLVIGINTWKLLANDSKGLDGFGVAIPADRLLSEFGQLRAAIATLPPAVGESVRGTGMMKKNKMAVPSARPKTDTLREEILRDYKLGNDG